MAWMKPTNRPLYERGYGGGLTNIPPGRPLPPGRGGGGFRPPDPRPPPPKPVSPYTPPKPGPAPLLAPFGIPLTPWLMPDTMASGWCQLLNNGGTTTCPRDPPISWRWLATGESCSSNFSCSTQVPASGEVAIGTYSANPSNTTLRVLSFRTSTTRWNYQVYVRPGDASHPNFMRGPLVDQPVVPTSLDPAEAPVPDTEPDPWPEWWPGRPNDPVYDPEKPPIGPWNPPSPYRPKPRVKPRRRKQIGVPPGIIPPELPDFGDGDGPWEDPEDLPVWPPYGPVPWWPTVPDAPWFDPVEEPGPAGPAPAPAPPYTPPAPARYQVPALQWELSPKTATKITIRRTVHTKVKDKSKKVRLPYWMAVAIGAYHSATEVNDFIESLADAMPDNRCSKLPGFQRLACVIENWRHIDPAKAAANVLWNEVEDRLVGRAMGALARTGINTTAATQWERTRQGQGARPPADQPYRRNDRTLGGDKSRRMRSLYERWMY